MNIYVGNLAYQITEEELRQAFEQFGEVTSVNLVKDRFTGQAKGFGFVEMASQADAEKAIKELDGTEISGRPMRVSQARPRAEGGGGHRGGGHRGGGHRGPGGGHRGGGGGGGGRRF